MTEEMQLLMKQYIKDNLRLDVQTVSVYNGGIDGCVVKEHFGVEE